MSYFAWNRPNIVTMVRCGVVRCGVVWCGVTHVAQHPSFILVISPNSICPSHPIFQVQYHTFPTIEDSLFRPDLSGKGGLTGKPNLREF